MLRNEAIELLNKTGGILDNIRSEYGHVNQQVSALNTVVSGLIDFVSFEGYNNRPIQKNTEIMITAAYNRAVLKKKMMDIIFE